MNLIVKFNKKTVVMLLNLRRIFFVFMPDIVWSLQEGRVPREVAPDWCGNVAFTRQKTISGVLGCTVNLQSQTKSKISTLLQTF